MVKIIAIILPLVAAIVVPADRQGLRGRSAAGRQALSLVELTDSTADFAALAAAGAEADWSYFVTSRADTAVITELQGTRWLRYVLAGDSLRHQHTESSRERSTFDVLLSPSSAEAAFSARGRRDMTFLYSDTGQTRISAIYPATVILAQGDTVRDCVMRTQTRRFLRTRTDVRDSISGMVTETERRWMLPDRLAPLAATWSRSVAVAGHDTATYVTAAVFPRAFNEGVNNAPAPTQQFSLQSHRSPYSYSLQNSEQQSAVAPPGSELSVSHTPATATVSITAPMAATVVVSDIAGRVWISTDIAPGSTDIDLSHLPSGEYLLTTRCGDSTQTLKLHHTP